MTDVTGRSEVPDPSDGSSRSAPSDDVSSDDAPSEDTLGTDTLGTDTLGTDTLGTDTLGADTNAPDASTPGDTPLNDAASTPEPPSETSQPHEEASETVAPAPSASVQQSLQQVPDPETEQNLQQDPQQPAEQPAAPAEPEPQEQAIIVTEQVELRRSPRYWRLMVLGAFLGVIAAFILTISFPPDPNIPVDPNKPVYSPMQVFGFLALICGVGGVALATLVGILLERIVGRKVTVVSADRVDVRPDPAQPESSAAAADPSAPTPSSPTADSPSADR